MSTLMGHGASKPVTWVGDNIVRSNIVPKGSWGAGTPFRPFLLHGLIESASYSSV
jgi:hypothetical protein